MSESRYEIKNWKFKLPNSLILLSLFLFNNVRFELKEEAEHCSNQGDEETEQTPDNDRIDHADGLFDSMRIMWNEGIHIERIERLALEKLDMSMDA